MPPEEFTPTEKRILAILSDGKPHTREELKTALWDELGSIQNLAARMTYLRRKLGRRGEGIAFTRTTGFLGTYTLVRLVASPYKE